MAQGKIHWDVGNYAAVEKVFRKSMEYCSENETWKLNVAHVLFMQEKYKDAISFYQPLVEKSMDKVVSLMFGFVMICLCRFWTFQRLFWRISVYPTS